MSARRRRGTDEEDLSEGEEETITVSNDDTEESDASEESEDSDNQSQDSVINQPEQQNVEQLEQDVKQLAIDKSQSETEEQAPPPKAPSPAAEEPQKEEQEENEEVDEETKDDPERWTKEEPGEDEVNEEEKDSADQDEDERHPAYIPRKGLFFLHDDRIDNEYPDGVTGAKMDLEASPPNDEASDVEEPTQNQEAQSGNEDEKEDEKENEENEKPAELDMEAERAYRAAKKAEKMGERWSHDKYDDDMQNPRTQQELVDRYGFDIRTLNPDQVDFSRPLGQSGDEPTPPPPTGSNSRRGGSRGGRGGGERGGRGSKNNRAVNGRQERPKTARRNNQQQQQQPPKMEDFPDLVISVNKKDGRQTKTQQQDSRAKNGRPEPKSRKGRNGADDMRNKSVRPNKIESKRRESREKFKKAPMMRDEPQSRPQRPDKRAPRREVTAGGDGYDQRQAPPDTRLRKQERRRRVEQEREHQLGLVERDSRRSTRSGVSSMMSGRQGAMRSPPRQRIEDPAPPIRSRRYSYEKVSNHDESSDLSNEDIVERRRPPPPRRKKTAQSPNQQSKQQIKPQLQAEIANVADILAKHENQARKMSAKHEYDARMRESPVKNRRDEKRKDDRRREPESRNKTRTGTLAGEEKSSKRYSARTRPEHWNARQSPSPGSNDQNFNDRQQQLPDDQVQDALEKHFNMSAPQAKKFVNQIKNQLHSNVPGEAKSGESNLRFPHGISAPSAIDPITSYPNTDVKSNTQNFNAKMGLRDRSNDPSSMQAFQAYHQQQQQALQAQFQLQSQQGHAFAANEALLSKDMVTRMAQQDPQLQAAFAHQARQQQQQQPAIPTMYPQQQSLHNNQMTQLSSPSGYVNTSISQPQGMANPLIANGTTYFHNNLEQHTRGKY